MAIDEHKTTLVVCWGELLWDLFPQGACLGGAPSNVAVHLAQLDTPTALITSLGRDRLGFKARSELAKRGIDTRGVQEHDHLPTGQVGIEVTAGEPSYTLHEGAWREIQCNAVARGILGSARALSFGTLSQESEEGLRSWRMALASLPPAAIRVCDPNLRGGRIHPERVLEHLQAASVVKINDGELTTIEKSYRQRDGVRWLIETLGVQWVAHTHGARGATLYAGSESATHPGYAAPTGGDNVGAGDAFTAVLTMAAIRKTPLDRSVEAANLVGSFVASQRGATPQIPASLRDRVTELLGALPAISTPRA